MVKLSNRYNKEEQKSINSKKSFKSFKSEDE